MNPLFLIESVKFNVFPHFTDSLYSVFLYFTDYLYSDKVDELARERSKGLHPRLRRSTAMSLLHRWSGIVSVGLQRAVAHIVARDTGADLARTQLEPLAFLADLATF